MDPQEALQFTKTGKLSGGNFIASDSSPSTSTANTPYPSRPPSSLPSHSYTLHQVFLATAMNSFSMLITCHRLILKQQNNSLASGRASTTATQVFETFFWCPFEIHVKNLRGSVNLRLVEVMNTLPSEVRFDCILLYASQHRFLTIHCGCRWREWG